MLIRCPPGIFSDAPLATNGLRWASGSNMRWRNGMPETVGLYRQLRDLGGNPVVTLTGTSIGLVRSIFPTSRPSGAQVMLASRNKLYCLYPASGSTISTGTRWVLGDITPAGLTDQPDTILPDMGRAKIGPFWWFVEFGRDMIMGRAGVFERPYVWDRDPTHLPTQIATAPRGAVAGLCTDNAFLVLFGCEAIVSTEPAELTVRWAKQGTYDVWTPSDVSSAGSQLLRNAGRIMGGGMTNLGPMCWTDKDLRRVNVLNDTKFFIRVETAATKCGLGGQLAWTEMGGKLWWFGSDKQLWRYEGGTPAPMACTVRQDTLDRITREGAHRVTLNGISDFDEVVIWCPTLPNHDPTVAATYNDREGCWSVLSTHRSCMSDRLGVLRPIAVALDGTVWEHESTVVDDSPSWADEVPAFRDWSLGTGHFLPPDREPLTSRTTPYRIVADLQRTHAPGDTSSVAVNLRMHDTLTDIGSPPEYEEILSRTDTTRDLNVRGSGHTLTMELSGNDKAHTRIGDMWIQERQEPGAER